MSIGSFMGFDDSSEDSDDSDIEQGIKNINQVCRDVYIFLHISTCNYIKMLYTYVFNT